MTKKAVLDKLPSVGNQINILAVVRDHAPHRVAEIDSELSKLEERQHSLRQEQSILLKLIAAMESL